VLGSIPSIKERKEKNKDDTNRKEKSQDMILMPPLEDLTSKNSFSLYQ
jgi:hypothetical protein